MHKTTLRKVGGSVMLTVPAALLTEVGLAPGANVGVFVSGGKLVVEKRRPRYTLGDLVEEHEQSLQTGLKTLTDAEAARDEDEERTWLDTPPVGREEI